MPEWVPGLSEGGCSSNHALWFGKLPPCASVITCKK